MTRWYQVSVCQVGCLPDYCGYYPTLADARAEARTLAHSMTDWPGGKRGNARRVGPQGGIAYTFRDGLLYIDIAPVPDDFDPLEDAASW